MEATHFHFGPEVSATYHEYTKKFDHMRTFQHENLLAAVGDGIKGAVVVDGGCGNGRSSERLAQAGAGIVYGYDEERPQIDQAVASLAEPEHQGLPIVYSVATPDTFRLPDGVLADVTTFNLVLPYANDPDVDPDHLASFFKQSRRVMKPGCRIVSTVVNPDIPCPPEGVRVGNRRMSPLGGTLRKMEFFMPDGTVPFSTQLRQIPREQYNQAVLAAGMKPRWEEMKRRSEPVSEIQAAVWDACEKAQLYSILIAEA